MLPPETIKVIIKKGCESFLPWVDFKIIKHYKGLDVINIRIPDWNIVVEYHIDWCLCKRKQLRWKIVWWILKIDY